MTDPAPQPEIPPLDPVPTQPEIDPAGTPDEVPPPLGESGEAYDLPGTS